MKHLLVNRTSPKGEPFVGTCAACGKQGLTLEATRDDDDCPNQRGMTKEQALIEAIEGDEQD